MRIQTRQIVCSILFILALTFTGCGKSTSQSPPKQQVQDAVAVVLPPFLSLDSIELEPISTGPETVKVNFKVIVTPKEDLCQVEREVEGTPKVTLLKVVQAAGTKSSLYGSVEAHRTMDQWTLGPPQVRVGLTQFGEPRGTFVAQSYITGSNEALAALKQQAANAELQRQAKEAALKQQERERLAREEQQAREDKVLKERQAIAEKERKDREEQTRIAFEAQRQKEMEVRKKEDEQRQKEEEAARQKIILATVKGTRYIGTKTDYKSTQRLRVVFIDQNDTLIRAEVSNPDNPKEERTFVGELLFNPKPEKEGGVAYSIVMSRIGGDDMTSDLFNIYKGRSVSLKLQLTDKGLEGIADLGLGDRLPIRLQREGASTSQAVPPAPPIPPVQKDGRRVFERR